jgi:hypothetical protein
MGEMGESRLRALGIAVQILEELPDELRPDSNIADMREMLAGNSTGRDGLILTQAVATALAFRAVNAMNVRRDYSNPEHAVAGLTNRNQEFSGHCHVAERSARADYALRIFQAAATTSRHVVIAAARSTRWDLADVRWRWTLKVL